MGNHRFTLYSFGEFLGCCGWMWMGSECAVLTGRSTTGASKRSHFTISKKENSLLPHSALTSMHALKGRYLNLNPNHTQMCNVHAYRHKQQDLSITCSLQLHANETLIGELADMTVIRNTLTHKHTSGMHANASCTHTQQSNVEVITEISLPLSPV